MHERLCIMNIYLRIDLIDIIYPCLEDLKAIKLLKDRNFEMINEVVDENSWLIDVIILTSNKNFKLGEKEVTFPHYLNKEYNELNPIFEPFKRVFILFLNYFEYDTIISTLNDIEKLSLRVDHIYLWGKSSEELENLTNPMYFKKGVESISYWFKVAHHMTDTHQFQVENWDD